MNNRRFVSFAIVLLSTAHYLSMRPCTAAEVARDEAGAATAELVEFQQDVMPILRRNCLACHREQEAEGGLNLESFASLIEGGDSGASVVAGDPATSLLMLRVAGEDEPIMPPEDNTVGASRLTKEQMGLLENWIRQGAREGTQAESVEKFNWQEIPDSVKSVGALDVSPDGILVAIAQANRIAMVDVQTRDEVGRLIDPSLLGGDVADVDLIQAISFSPDGDCIATGGFRTVRIWRPTHDLGDSIDVPWQHAVGIVATQSGSSKIAMVNVNGAIEIWDETDRTLQNRFRATQDAIVALEWLPSNDTSDSRLLVVDSIGNIQIWDAGGTEPVASIDTSVIVRTCTVSGDGLNFAVINQANQVDTYVFSPPTPDAPASIQRDKQNVGEVKNATAIAFDDQSELGLLIAAESGGVRRFALASGAATQTIQPESISDSLAVVSNPARWITGGRSGKTQVWNAADGMLLKTFPARCEDALTIARVDQENQRLKTAFEQQTASQAELEKRIQEESDAIAKLVEQRDAVAEELAQELAKELPTDEAELAKANELRESKKTSVAQVEQSILSANLAKKKVEEQVEQLKQQMRVSSLRSTRCAEHAKQLRARSEAAASPVVSLTARDDGKMIATKHRDGSVRVADITLESRQSLVLSHVNELDEHANESLGSVVCFYGDKVLASAMGVSPRVANVNKRWQLQRVIGGLDSPLIVDRVTSLDFHPDGRRIAIGSGLPSRSGQIKLVDVDSGEVLEQPMHAHADTVLGLKFSPDGRMLASASADETIGLSDVATGQSIRSLEGHTHHVLAIDWQAGGRTLASASADQTVRVWDVSSGQTNRKIEGFPQELTGLGFIGSSGQVAVGCGSGEVRICDVGSGGTVRSFVGGGGFLLTVAVDFPLKQVIAGTSDGSAMSWNLDTGESLGTLVGQDP